MKKIGGIVVSLLLAIVTCGIVFERAAPVCKQASRIIAKEEGKVGELIRLEVKCEADDYYWLVVPESPDFEIYADGRKAVFSARKTGKYLFIASYCKNSKVTLLRHIIEIKGPPKPITPPGPDASILELIPYWCHNLKIKPEAREALATNFTKVASSASAGNYENVQELINHTAELNKPLGQKNLLDKITSYIVEKASSGELETMDQHIVLWNRIAVALNEST